MNAKSRCGLCELVFLQCAGYWVKCRMCWLLEVSNVLVTGSVECAGYWVKCRMCRLLGEVSNVPVTG